MVAFPGGIIESLTCPRVIKSCKCIKFKQDKTIEQLKDTFDAMES